MARYRKMVSASAVLEHWVNEKPELELSKNQCFMCGCMQPLERAHIKPENKGGKGEASNLHLLCKTCHTATEHFTGELYWKIFYQKYELGYDFGIYFHMAKYNAAIEHGKKNNINCPLESFKNMLEAAE